MITDEMAHPGLFNISIIIIIIIIATTTTIFN
jgi:hypothetical protein